METEAQQNKAQLLESNRQLQDAIRREDWLGARTAALNIERFGKLLDLAPVQAAQERGWLDSILPHGFREWLGSVSPTPLEKLDNLCVECNAGNHRGCLPLSVAGGCKCHCQFPKGGQHD